MRNLSVREKILIYIAMLLLIVSGYNWFLLQPTVRTYDQGAVRLKQLEIQRDMADEELHAVIKAEDRYTIEREKLQDSFRHYAPVSSRTNLEEHVLSYLEEGNLEIMKTFMEDEDVEVKTEYDSGEERRIRTGTIEVSVQGQKADFLRLLDKLDADPVLCVDVCNLYREDGTEEKWSMNLDIIYAAPGSMEDMRNAYGQVLQE